uniref:Uncharacterized protein n=1 Tax=Tanacetum cinerariifolium TaxID=118510 RepID=A0A699HU15_TANCI|nr:hypothetical protein [Tanacetum cinerariifolium]
MGDEHLNTIPKTESDEVIKSSVEDLVPIPSEFEGIFDDTCDVPFCDNSPPLNVLNDNFELFSDFNNYCTLSDDDSFEDINYVEASPPDSELISLEEFPSPFPIPVEDSDSFFEKSDTSLSYTDNSLPEFETFSDHTKETSSGSTTTHAGNSLPEYDLFLFENEPDQGELTSVVGNIYLLKDKNKAKPNKTEHGMEKRRKVKVKVNKKVNQVKVKSQKPKPKKSYRGQPVPKLIGQTKSMVHIRSLSQRKMDGQD